ncbi:carboxypeptidase d, partial [Mytilus galloprovincialis]
LYFIDSIYVISTNRIIIDILNCICIGMVSESQRWIRLGMNFFIVFVSLFHVTLSLDFQYHNYQDLTNYLTNMSNTYPDLTHLYSIGKTVQKRDLHVLAIGKLPQNHLTLRPHVKYVGNMHGN